MGPMTVLSLLGGPVSAVLLCFSPGGEVMKAVLVIPSVMVLRSLGFQLLKDLGKLK